VVSLRWPGRGSKNEAWGLKRLDTGVLSAVEVVGCEGIGKMHVTQLFCSGPLDTFRRCLSAF